MQAGTIRIRLTKIRTLILVYLERYLTKRDELLADSEDRPNEIVRCPSQHFASRLSTPVRDPKNGLDIEASVM